MKEIYKIPKGQNVATSEGWKHIDTEIKNFVYEIEQVPTNWEELKELCKKLEEKTKGKKRFVYCSLLGEIFVCLDGFGEVGFCLSLKNIENPNRDIVHIKIINFKVNLLYNSFDMPLSNSIGFIKSLIGEE